MNTHRNPTPTTLLILVAAATWAWIALPLLHLGASRSWPLWVVVFPCVLPTLLLIGVHCWPRLKRAAIATPGAVKRTLRGALDFMRQVQSWH